MIDAITARLEATWGRERLKRLHGSRVAVIGTGLLDFTFNGRRTQRIGNRHHGSTC